MRVALGVDAGGHQCVGDVEGVQAVAAARPHADRRPAVGAGEPGPVGLGVDRGDLEPQRDRAQGQGAGGVRLAGADLPGDEDVRVGDQPVAVQLERGERRTGRRCPCSCPGTCPCGSGAPGRGTGTPRAAVAGRHPQPGQGEAGAVRALCRRTRPPGSAAPSPRRIGGRAPSGSFGRWPGHQVTTGMPSGSAAAVNACSCWPVRPGAGPWTPGSRRRGRW